MSTGERVWADAAEHVAVYRSTDGAEGHLWHGRPHLLLTTTGRRSGRAHTVPLVHARLATPAGERLVVAGSAGGSPRDPAWVHNLRADPRVGVRLLAQVWATTAEVAAGGTEEQGWEALGRVWAGFLRYRRDTPRHVPLVLLGPAPTVGAGEPGPAGRDALP